MHLQYHRAVHSTQSDFKYNLRECERALQTREALRVISGNFTALDMSESWERYLFALFHDATPGTSIHSVYQELNAELKALAERQYELATEEWPREGSSDGSDSFTIINQLAWERYTIVELPDNRSSVVGDDMQDIDGQLFALVKLDGLSATHYVPKLSSSVLTLPNSMMATSTSLSNGIVDAEFDKFGQLESMTIRGESLLLRGCSVTLHDDNPEAYDAWDMDHSILWMKELAIQKPVILHLHAFGDVVSILRSDPIPIGSSESSMVIEYRLYAKQDSLQVSCSVDWKETHKTLRYEIRTGYCGDTARFGAPFNFVERSQIPQTHKEEGQWEVPASRWASILNGNGDGLSIITQSKYGFSAKMGNLSFTLLRSSTFPDPTADRGYHTIRFAIAKHQNTFQRLSGDDLIIPTAAKADELFTYPVVLTKESLSALTPKPFIEFTTLGSAVPSWAMPSMSNSQRGFCVRLHEVAGADTQVAFTIQVLQGMLAKVETVNFNEKRLSDLDATDCGPHSKLSYSLVVAAYKIVTLRVSFV